MVMSTGTAGFSGRLSPAPSRVRRLASRVAAALSRSDTALSSAETARSSQPARAASLRRGGTEPADRGLHGLDAHPGFDPVRATRMVVGVFGIVTKILNRR